MSKPTYPILVVALVSILSAPPLSAFAQQKAGHVQGAQLAPHRGARSAPNRAARLRPHTGAVRSHNFHGHVYHGRLAWRHGRWHHTTRKGRFGWWWDVGGVWYFYPEPIEGPPAYVSDVEVEGEGEETPAQPEPPKEPRQVFYYRPGDLKGTAYQTIEECSQARQQAGDVGICVMK